MLNKSIKEKMDKLFFWFEDTHQEEIKSGSNPYYTELAFQFFDYINSDEGVDLICESFGWDKYDDADKVKDIQSHYSKGIDVWLEA